LKPCKKIKNIYTFQNMFDDKIIIQYKYTMHIIVQCLI